MINDPRELVRRRGDRLGRPELGAHPAEEGPEHRRAAGQALAWAVQEQIRYKDLKHGIGGSLSFDTPIGPADFSLGRSFLLRQADGGSTITWSDILFYFSIGHAMSF